MLIDYVHCTGSEPRIWGHCTHFTHYYGCTHEDDVGVRCQPGEQYLVTLNGECDNPND